MRLLKEFLPDRCDGLVGEGGGCAPEHESWEILDSVTCMCDCVFVRVKRVECF